MGAVRRVLALTVFGLFVLAVVVRPLTRFGGALVTGDGLDAGALVAWSPAILVAVLAVVVTVYVLFVSDGPGYSEPDNPPTAGRGEGDHGEGRHESAGHDEGRHESTREREVDEVGGNRPTRPNLLGGQGGTRNRGFEIEEEAPETDVDEHLAYLSDRLGEEDLTDGEHREEVTNDGFPSQCPKPHCEARWSGGLLGVGGGNYERLGGGQVRCTECNGVSNVE